MQVTFYSFTKRENSTARPGDGTTFDCILKSPSSVVAPVITLQIGRVTDPSVYNYCYIPDFDRFYWVQEWSWSSACWTAALKCDVLATYRTEIGSASMYVLRASNAYDGKIIDTLYPTNTQPVFYTDTGSYMWGGGAEDEPALGGGHFVLTIAGNGIDNVYSISAFVIRSFLNDISDNFVSEDNGFLEGDASFALQKAMIDPFSYIKSCVFLPFVPTGTNVDVINVGGIDFETVAKMPHRIQTRPAQVFSLRHHPQYLERGTYMDQSNIIRRLYFPPFGLITLNNDLAINYSRCLCIVNVDSQTGIGKLTVGYGNSDTTIEVVDTVVNSAVGVPVQLSQVYIDWFNASNVALRDAGGGVGGFLGNLVTGNIGGAVSGLVGSATASIADQKEATRPRLDTVGSPSSWVSLKGKPQIYTECLIAVDDDLQHNGRPLCQMRTPASLGGYMLIQDGDVPIHGTAEEAAEVRSYLEGGFYYE